MSFIKITEQPSLHEDLEQLSVRSLLEGINEEDQKVALAVRYTWRVFLCWECLL